MDSELDRGEGIPFKGNYSAWLEAKEKRYAVEERSSDRRAKYLKKELEWVRMSPKARQAKNKARIQAYENLVSQEQEKVASDLKIYIPPGPRLGDLVVEAKEVRKSFGDHPLFSNMNFQLPPGGIVGVIGPNGAGKTTLFKMIVGFESPDGVLSALGHRPNSDTWNSLDLRLILKRRFSRLCQVDTIR